MRPLTGPLVCAHCKRSRDRSEFGIRKSTGTLLSWCRQCYREYDKQYRLSRNVLRKTEQQREAPSGRATHPPA